MERIIAIIEDKLKSQEQEISLFQWEVADLKRKLAEAEKTIEAQAQIITDLKGEAI